MNICKLYKIMLFDIIRVWGKLVGLVNEINGGLSFLLSFSMERVIL